MFRCFVDSLVRPKNIASHVDMKIGKLIGYILLLVLIISVPSIVTVFTSSSVQESMSTTLVNGLKSQKSYIDYTITDGKLESKRNEEPNITVFVLGAEEEGANNTASLFVNAVYFVLNPNNHDVSESITYPGIMINLLEERIDISMVVPNQEAQQIVSATYNEVNANGINFNEVYNYSTYTFQQQIETVINNLFGTYITLINCFAVVPVVIVSSAISLIFEIVVLCFFVFIFFRSIQLSFGELFKIVTFCMTPTAILTIYGLLPFGSVWSTLLYIVGQVITIVYFYKAIRQTFINKMKKE